MSKEPSEQNSKLPLVIVNPKSAAGSTREAWAATASELRTHFGPYSAAFTKGAGDAIAIAERAANEGRTFIIACGGDGTINEVANGIIRSGADAELGILPSGTGGDFRRSLKMPNQPREAARALREGFTKRLDAGKVTFSGNDGEEVSRFFMNVSSVGLAASIIDRVKGTKAFDWLPTKHLRGQANFAASTLREIADLEPFMLRVRIDDGDEMKLRSINFCVANARYFGGGMMIAPDASLSDGLLDIVNIGAISAAKVVARGITLYRGTHLGLDEVDHRLARKIEVGAFDPTEEIRLETDGELPGRLPAVYESVPNAIKVRMPKVG
ncbi:MAG TPA: diacylglycerol kinase family lipid kinase [Pyrinomonadaceae bacterium]|nr:diacylglycerol kinase family lipid kinase [Pyrinomonadaceae bacterium]